MPAMSYNVKINWKILEKLKKNVCRGGEPLSSTRQTFPHESINRPGFPKPLTNFHSHWALIQYVLWGDRKTKVLKKNDR